MAPYLVGPMRKDSALLERLFREGHGKRWGIYCTSREKFAEVRHKLLEVAPGHDRSVPAGHD